METWQIWRTVTNKLTKNNCLKIEPCWCITRHICILLDNKCQTYVELYKKQLWNYEIHLNLTSKLNLMRLVIHHLGDNYVMLRKLHNCVSTFHLKHIAKYLILPRPYRLKGFFHTVVNSCVYFDFVLTCAIPNVSKILQFCSSIIPKYLIETWCVVYE